MPPWLVGYLLMTGAGLGIYFALVRRRTDPDPAPAFATAMAGSDAAAGSAGEPGAVDASSMAGSLPAPNPAATSLLRPDDEDNGTDPDEAGVPRWLRPSVRRARQEGVRYPSRDGWG